MINLLILITTQDIIVNGGIVSQALKGEAYKKTHNTIHTTLLSMYGLKNVQSVREAAGHFA